MDETLLIPIFAGVAVVTLIGGVGLSQGPPLAPHYREEAEIAADDAAAFAAYRAALAP